MLRAVSFLLFASLLIGAAPVRGPDYTPELEARVLARVEALVARHYWNRAAVGARWAATVARFRPRLLAANDRRRFYTVLGEMLATLGDSHVYAIDPVQVAIGKARASGEAEEGFGLTTLPDDDGVWRVSRVRLGSPGARAGVALGWELAQVNGQPFDIDFQPQDGEVTVMRFVDERGAAHLLRLTAERQEVEPVRRATRLPGGVLLIGLDGFDPGADRWLAGQLREGAPAAVILDLRDNDGGDADVIARVAGLFFAANRPLVRRIGVHETVQQTRGAGDRAYLGPLAVLIGPESASGAEALAALVDESGRGLTIGQRTAGALTGAAEYQLPDGGLLSVAEFDLRTPGGRRLEGVGLVPQVTVTPTLADRRAGRDPELARARAMFSGQHRSP